MNQTDLTAALYRLQVQQHQRGPAETLRLKAYGHDGIGRLAKACGVTPDIIRAWERGAAMPSTSEAARWLDTLYAAQPAGPGQRAGDNWPA